MWSCKVQRSETQRADNEEVLAAYRDTLSQWGVATPRVTGAARIESLVDVMLRLGQEGLKN